LKKVLSIGDSKGMPGGAMAPPAENYVLKNLGERLYVVWIGIVGCSIF